MNQPEINRPASEGTDRFGGDFDLLVAQVLIEKRCDTLCHLGTTNAVTSAFNPYEGDVDATLFQLLVK